MKQNKPTKRDRAYKEVYGLKQKSVLNKTSRGAQNKTLFSLRRNPEMLANKAKIGSKIMQEKGKKRLTLEEQISSNFWTKKGVLQPLKITSKMLGWMVEVVGYEV